MTLNRVTLGRAVSFIKYLASVVSLIFLTKTLIWNKITFAASNSLNLAELELNEPMESIYKNVTNIFFLLDLPLFKVNISRTLQKSSSV